MAKNWEKWTGEIAGLGTWSNKISGDQLFITKSVGKNEYYVAMRRARGMIPFMYIYGINTGGTLLPPKPMTLKQAKKLAFDYMKKHPRGDNHGKNKRMEINKRRKKINPLVEQFTRIQRHSTNNSFS